MDETQTTPTQRYVEFFVNSAEGQAYVKRLKSLIDFQHTQAESDIDHARDFTQRAAGIREALKLIDRLTVEAKKPMQ